jgi:hypothetical protein
MCAQSCWQTNGTRGLLSSQGSECTVYGKRQVGEAFRIGFDNFNAPAVREPTACVLPIAGAGVSASLRKQDAFCTLKDRLIYKRRMAGAMKSESG